MRSLIPRLDSFHQEHPQIEVAVTTVTTVTIVHEELRGGFDVAIRRGIVGAGMLDHGFRQLRF
jgi:LysR family transcriptional regulator, glycine cleavage system transcriptional activator